MAVTQQCDTECCCMWPADITVEYCIWSDMWYSFRTSIYLTCIFKQNIVHGVTCDTVSEHQCILHYIETEYCTWIDVCSSVRTSVYLTCTLKQNIVHGDMWFSFRKSVYLTYILKQNIIHGVICDRVSEHQYISHVHWITILYTEWYVIQF